MRPRHKRTRSAPSARSALLALITAGLLVGCGTQVLNPVSGQTERSVMTEADEIKVGAEQHQQVLADYGVLKDARLQAYVDGIGQKLAKASQRPQLPWTFTLLDSTEVNAFALPGGYVYVTRGLMSYMDSEAELAGVIGHEIGHVTARHGAQRATRQQTAGIGVFAAAVLGAVLESQGVAGAGRAATDLGQNVAAGYVASYSREQELQADQLGADYLIGNGYDPQNMVDVIQVLKNQEVYAADRARAAGRAASSGQGWLASHPSNDQRLQAIRDKVAQFTGQHGGDGRDRYLQAINGLPFGDSREQGLVRGQNFFHEPLGFAITAPAGWQVRNGSDSLALVSGAGDAALVLRLVPPAVGSDREKILRDGLNVQGGRSEQRSLHGLPATHYVGSARNAQGQVQPLQATVVSGPGERSFVLAWLAKDAATLQRSQAALGQAEASFRPMTAADRAAAQAWVLRALPFPAGGYAALAQASPMGADAEGQLRLLNGHYPTGTPRVGQRVKVVQAAP